MKQTRKHVTFESLLSEQLKNGELKLIFEEKRFYLQIARLVRDLREKSGLAQSDLAQRAKVSQPMIARLEKGDQLRAPTFETIYKILKALGYRMEINVKPQGKAAA